MTTKYIIDIPSNRVIFFTKDETVPLRAGEEAIIYEDVNPPPEGMTLANAWSWKLFGRDFKRMEWPTPVHAKTDVDVFDENKQETLKALNIRINDARKNVPQTALNYNFLVQSIILNELNDSTGPWPMLEALAKVKNMSIDEYRSTAKDNVHEVNKILIRTEQWYQHYLDRINSASNNADLYVIRDELANRNFKVDLF